MTDVFSLTDGRILMSDTDGTVVFDTDERLFTATDELTGSISMDELVARNNNSNDIPFLNIDTYHAIGRCNEAADTVRGSFYVTTSGGSQGLSDIGWFNASGSYVHYWGSIPGVLGSPAQALVTQCVVYTFVCFGGGAYLHQRVQMKATISLSSGVTNTITVLPTTFRYKLLVGTWI